MGIRSHSYALRVELYDSGMNCKAGITGVTEDVTTDVLQPGTYYVKITSAAGDPVDQYEFFVYVPEPTADWTDAKHLADIEAEKCVHDTDEILPPADTDWYNFTLLAAFDIEIEIRGDENRDAEMWLYNSSGVPTAHIGYDDNSGEGLLPKITAQSLEPDTYYFKLESKDDESLQYSIVLKAATPGQLGDSYEDDDTYDKAKLITDGETQTHSFYPAGDEDWVKFTLDSAAEVTVETSGPGDADTEMWLYSHILLYEDFNDGVADGWTGYCHVNTTTGTLECGGGPEDCCSHYYSTWKNYTLECDVLSCNVCECYVDFRVVADCCTSGYSYDGTCLTKWNPSTHQRNNIACGPSASVPYHFKVVLSGNHIQCFVDDELVIDTYDSSFDHGGIGACTAGFPESEYGSFDNFVVYGLASLASDDNSGSGSYSKITKTLNPGTYYIKVKEKNNNATGSYSIKLLVGTSPYASFTYTPSLGLTTGNITFNASDSYDLEGSISSYSWDFDASYGIQEDATGVEVTHQYTTAGNYTVTLTVTGTSGTDTVSKNVTVKAPPVANFSYSGSITTVW